MAVGIIGGATKVHPAAKSALKLMGVRAARELAKSLWLSVSPKISRRFARWRPEGIQRGHMGLHARQMAIAAGAQGDMVERVAAQLVAERAVRLDRALEIVGKQS